MNKLTFLVVILCAHICYLRGSPIVTTCPEYKPVNNFNLKSLTGTWFEAARYPTEYENTNCSRFNFVPKGEDKLFTQHFGPEKSVDSDHYYESTFGVTPGAGDKGILFHEAIYGKSRTPATLHEYILAMDNDNFYISAECQYDKRTNKILEFAWVVTKSKNFGSEVKAAIDNYLKSLKDIDASRLIWLDLHDESC